MFVFVPRPAISRLRDRNTALCSCAASLRGDANRKGDSREHELVENSGYDAGVHEVPDELDREIAEIKLDAEGVGIDSLSEEQTEYMDSWEHGT